jgi:hypothetical protein
MIVSPETFIGFLKTFLEISMPDFSLMFLQIMGGIGFSCEIAKIIYSFNNCSMDVEINDKEDTSPIELQEKKSGPNKKIISLNSTLDLDL